MLDVELRKSRGRLRQPAVFTYIAGSAANENPQGLIHRYDLRSRERALRASGKSRQETETRA